MEKKSFCGWTRWVHLYLSMFSFAALFFFALTGITLNHPSWTENRQKVETLKGYVDPAWITGTDTASVQKSLIVDYIRNQHNLRGNLTEFRNQNSHQYENNDQPFFSNKPDHIDDSTCYLCPGLASMEGDKP